MAAREGEALPPAVVVGAVGDLPGAVAALPAADDEGGLLQGVAPDDFEVLGLGVDRAVRVGGHRPDDVGVVLDEGVHAVAGAEGVRAEDVDVVAPHADGESVDAAVVKIGQARDVLREEALRPGGAEEDLDVALRRGRGDDGERRAGDPADERLERVGRLARPGDFAAQRLLELDRAVRRGEPVVDLELVVVQADDDLGLRLAVLDEDGAPALDAAGFRRLQILGGVRVVGLVVLDVVQPLGVLLRLVVAEVRALGELDVRDGEDDLLALGDLPRPVVELELLDRAVEEALEGRALLVRDVPDEVGKAVFAARLGVVVVAEGRRRHPVARPGEGKSVGRADAEVVEIAGEGRGRPAVHLRRVADEGAEAFVHVDARLEGEDVVLLRVHGELDGRHGVAVAAIEAVGELQAQGLLFNAADHHVRDGDRDAGNPVRSRRLRV